MMQTFTRTELVWIMKSMAVDMSEMEEDLQDPNTTPAEKALLQIRFDGLVSIRERLSIAINSDSKRIAIK